MAQNPGKDPEIPLILFCGEVTNIDPVALPLGASPDCSDMQFLPAGASSRACLQKVFATPLGSVTITYSKTYIDPSGTIRDLYLDSAGNLWVENITTGSIPSVIATTTPGSYARSVTAFGREYIAISDGAHGTEIPLQLSYDAAGNIQLDRVTSDGPGTSPDIANLIIPPTNIATSGSPLSLTITEIDPQNADPISGFFTSINVFTSSSLAGVQIGLSVVIVGTVTAFDGAWGPITGVFSGSPNLIQITAFIPSGTPFWVGSQTMTIQQGALQRQSNVVTGITNTAHNLQPGYQVQITVAVAGIIGTSIASIVINNENLPGIATVTMNLAAGQTSTGVVPGMNVSITGVMGIGIGGGIASISCQGNVVTVTTNSAHGLNPAAIVNIGGTGTTLDTTAATVANVTAPTVFTYGYVSVNLSESGSGTVTLNWPIPDTPTPSYFQIVAAPSATSFQVALSYCDTPAGGFTSGSVSYAWNGTFFVQSVPPPVVTQQTTLSGGMTAVAATASVTSGASIADGDTIQIGTEQMLVVSGGGTGTLTVTRGINGTTAAIHANASPVSTVQFSFTYQQNGPDATASPVSGELIVATPYGQAAPGQHLMTCFFIDREGGITSYSPPVKIIANGGQYFSVTNLPIGPPTTMARGVAFTGAQGAYLFYIPAPPQINGQLVGTATQINDNVTTAAVFDFGDPTLFAGLGISIQGNNLANQITIEGALGFGFYGSRILTWGQRNVVDNFLNMSINGGYLPNASTVPTGWNAALNAGGALAAGRFNTQAWQITVTAAAGNKGTLSQSFYEDLSGAPIARANTQYRIRGWFKPTAIAADLTFTMSMTSASTGFSATATISGSVMNAAGSWLEASFSSVAPMVIPQDFALNLYASSTVTTLTLLIQNLNLIYSETPYTLGLIGSYANNPEGFDGVSGPFGPVNDTHPVLDVGIIRDNLYMLTQDPGGRLHETSQGISEPADWVVNEVASMCGVVSAFCLTRSQADDSTASGGEEFFSWMSCTGYRIFGGEEPDKISQEIQRPPGIMFPGAPSDLNALNLAALKTVWSLNDPQNKIIYLGIPTGSATAPNVIWQLSYLGLDSAAAIVANPPIHKALSGQLVATDMGRKWSPWQLSMNGAALLYRGQGDLRVVFLGGNGNAMAPISGTCNTQAIPIVGTIVTQVSGGSFSLLQLGSAITINGIATAVTGFLSPNQILVAGNLGNHSGVAFSANVLPGYGNVYTLNPNYFTDDDYGLVEPYYTTAAFPDKASEERYGLGGGYKMASWMRAMFYGVGFANITLLVNFLNNQWPLSGQYLLSQTPLRGAPWGCGQATGDLMFVRFSSTPNPAGTTAKPTTDNQFSLSRLSVWMRKNARYLDPGVWP